MNRRNFFGAIGAAIAMPVLGNTRVAEPTKPSGEWHIADGELVTMPLRPLSEQEVAAIVGRELTRFIEGVAA